MARSCGSKPIPPRAAHASTIEKGTGDIVDECYVSLPTNYVIRRVGQVPSKLALTFDDGPDPEWTPQILDILKAKHVPATFFVIGAEHGGPSRPGAAHPGRRP